MSLDVWLPTLIAVVALAAVATVGFVTFRIPEPWSVVAALGRAALQLAALSLVLTGIIRDPVWVGLGLAVMFVAAVLTAARRARRAPRRIPMLALAMILGPTVVGAIVFGSGAIEFSPRYALAIGGIVIGNTMTIAILEERVLVTSIRERWDEVEGWLALGATPRQSTWELARLSLHTALLPSIDQTRTTGIVVLPGAFVGAVFAGASPLEAGRFQLVVLASILASGVITGLLVARQASLVIRRPADLTTKIISEPS